MKPNSKINGVQLGVITWSFLGMRDQSAEATLQYILDCGINAIELMGSVAENYLGKPQYKIDRRTFYRLMRLDRKKEISRDEKKQLADLMQQQKSYEKAARNWKKNRNPNDYLKLRKMFNDAGVEIYAFKPDYLLGSKNSDADINYAMKTGKVLGASHVTLELPGPPYGPKDPEHTLRLGKLAEKNDIKVAYHGHTQQHTKWWDTALKQSESNVMNPDLGHYIAAGNTDIFEFLSKMNKKIYSMHIKDRKTPANGQDYTPFGMGDTPIVDVLQLMRDKKYSFPATIEYEYKTPENSTIIDEIKKCVDYCKDALES
ncbi:MAG: sugar phosphate isomerase/epimerase family protein [Flavobacteriaceae bacterium]